MQSIAHHYIPSVASAWARAEPKHRIVRVESLWGIPEGLYWYSHDTYEIDTLSTQVDSQRTFTALKFPVLERLRYKGTYIASNESGNWIPYSTAEPRDWGKTIPRKAWLYEIAQTTRLIAEREGMPVSVMWFIENHRDATPHAVLPWFHSKSELKDAPIAAPRQKRRMAKDHHIQTVEDWHRLQSLLQTGNRVERVVVEPTDPDLIRNRAFADELARLAAEKKFVVELSGGLLSHAYYILQRAGAQVECVDLFGAGDDVIEFNKLVRDRIPETIQAKGEQVETVRLAGEALIRALQQKLVEEAFEVLDAPVGTELISELADVNEVIGALAKLLQISPADIEKERIDKSNRRGAFDLGLMLIKTSTPHSIPEHQDIDSKLEMQEVTDQIIKDSANLPHIRVFGRPDRRQIDNQVERRISFTTEVNKLGEAFQKLQYSLPIERRGDQHFEMTIDMRRSGASVRGVVTITPINKPVQLELPEIASPIQENQSHQLEFEF